MKDMLVTPAYDGIVFDLDGTLIHSLEDLTDALNVTLDDYGLPPATYYQGEQWIGHGMRELVRKALPYKLARCPEILDAATAMTQQVYLKQATKKTRPYAGIPDVLAYCARHDVPFAVSTNKPDAAAQEIIKTLFKDVPFTVVRGNLPGVPHKPNPQQTLEVLSEMGLEPARTLYVGDSITDYQTAQNCGMPCALVSYGYGDKKELRACTDALWLKSPGQIIDALKYGEAMYSVFEENKSDQMPEN